MRRAVIAALWRVAVMSMIQYRANFLLQFGVGASNLVGVLLPLSFVWGRAPDIGGYSYPEAMLVAGFFLVLNGIFGTFVEPNLAAVVAGVRTGTLDHLLLKPADSQLLASLQKVDPARMWDVIGGVCVGGWSLWHLPLPTPGNVVLAALLFGFGLAAMYSLWVAVISLSFWFVRVDNLRYLLWTVADAGRWPVSIYRGWLRMMLTVVVPVALVTSYPAMALLGEGRREMAVHAAAVAAGGLVVSRWAWKRALAHYSSASS